VAVLTVRKASLVVYQEAHPNSGYSHGIDIYKFDILEESGNTKSSVPHKASSASCF